jgi:hypothetical protein
MLNQFPENPKPKQRISAATVVLSLVLLITLIAVFVPFSPAMPGTDLDSSWQFAMNQAMSQGLSIGKDVIFTFGPYASIYTKAYHPSTDCLMLCGSMYLALSCWVYLIVLMRNVRWVWVLAYCFVLTGLMFTRDALLLTVPLLIVVLCLKMHLAKDDVSTNSKFAPFYVTFLFAPFGLLPLIKGSMLILCLAYIGLCVAFFVVNRHRLLALVCICTPIASTLFFWIAAGQSLATLPDYFVNMAPIVSGYTEAMSMSGPARELITYVLGAAVLLFAIFRQTQITKSAKVFLFFSYFVFLFLCFKTGFVRQDFHTVIAGESMLIGVLLLPFILNPRIVLSIIIFPVVAWACIDADNIPASARNPFANAQNVVSSASDGLENRIEHRKWPAAKFKSAVASIGARASFPVLRGTTDIYENAQSFLISSENTWSPRPIFQSYSAYTPALAEVNRQHLLGPQAPENIIFKVESFNARFPSLDDGASWPTLLAKYRPTSMENDFLFLQKNANSGATNAAATNPDENAPLTLTSAKHAFGEMVKLPVAAHPIFVQIDFKQTLMGKLASFFFKPSQIQIKLALNNGQEKQYRLIASMAKSGFVISPLIENTDQFGMLFGKMQSLDGQIVKSMQIVPQNGKMKSWSNDYTVTFSQIDIPPAVDFPQTKHAEKDCMGSIDRINGISPAPDDFSSSKLMKVEGWLALSADKKITLPDDIYVVLTDSRGTRIYSKAEHNPRPDVGAYLKEPLLDRSGYSATIDTSKLSGEYTLGIANKVADKVGMCPQFNVFTTIAN